jgi:hypothetical protein
MASISEFKGLCSFDSGRFTAALSARLNAASQTYTYAANILCDNRRLFETQLRHELAGLSHAASKEGEQWLNRWLFVREISNRPATGQDLQDFQCAVRTSEKLIGQFAQHGHEEVLKNPKLLQNVELEALKETVQQTRSILRGR